MGGFVWIAFIVFFIVLVDKSKKNEKQKKMSQLQKMQQMQQQTQQVQRGQGSYGQPAAQGWQQSTGSYGQPRQGSGIAQSQGAASTRQMTAEDRAKLEQYRQRKAAGKTVPQTAQKSGNIVERAKSNAAQYSRDTTLEELETHHNHSERMAATTDAERGMAPHPVHPKDAGHVSDFILQQDEELLGSVEDLMVKGYWGKLSFERDFLGEAMDMIGRFTVPDTVPEISKS